MRTAFDAFDEAHAFSKTLDMSGFWNAHPGPAAPSAALQQDKQRLLRAWLRCGIVRETRPGATEEEREERSWPVRYAPDVYPRVLAVLDEHHVRAFVRFFVARCRRAGMDWPDRPPIATLSDVADVASDAADAANASDASDAADAKVLTALVICMRHYFI